MTNLSARQLDLLKVLRFRESLGTCWLAAEFRGRYRLYVPTMMTDKHHEPLTSVNDRTLRVLENAGLIQVGPSTDLPAWHAKYRRRRGEWKYGSTVVITAAGREHVRVLERAP